MYDVLDNPTIENLVPAAAKMTMYIHDSKMDLVVVEGLVHKMLLIWLNLFGKSFIQKKRCHSLLLVGWLCKKRKLL